VLPLAYGINYLVNRLVPYRIEQGGERQGIDLYELGAGAYPEFVTHREDFLRR
jgi:Amt family ammonium transporter